MPRLHNIVEFEKSISYQLDETEVGCTCRGRRYEIREFAYVQPFAFCVIWRTAARYLRIEADASASAALTTIDMEQEMNTVDCSALAERLLDVTGIVPLLPRSRATAAEDMLYAAKTRHRPRA